MNTRNTIIMVVSALAAMSWGCSAPTRQAPGVGSGPERVEGGAIFRYHHTDARTVHLVGNFNDWSPGADPMTDANGDGEWSLFYPLEPGRYAYKFVINGKRWIPDPTNSVHEPDGFDGINSIVVIVGQPAADGAGGTR